ncbi:TPA: hypothetical protein ACH3X1_015959 [Trebouxia sp. C0004]
MAVGQLAVQEIQGTKDCMELLLRYGDGGDKVWALDGLKNAVVKKDRRMDELDRPKPASVPLAIEGPKESYLSEVALAMGYDRKTVQPALPRLRGGSDPRPGELCEARTSSRIMLTSGTSRCVSHVPCNLATLNVFDVHVEVSVHLLLFAANMRRNELLYGRGC